jgi:hypothetical protein
VAKVPEPAQGYTAYFVEMTYPSPSGFPLKFTTGVWFTPSTLPHPPYQPNRPQ